MFDSDGWHTITRGCDALVPAVLIAVSGSTIKYLRVHHGKEPFVWREFLSGMAVAAFAGIVVQAICMGAGLNAWLSAAAVAMAGYGGGRTLDLLMSVAVRKVKGE